MKCNFTSDDINRYIDGVLSQDRADIIKEHLNECYICSSYYNSIILTRDYIKENIKLKSDIHKRVVESVDSTRYKNKKFIFRLERLRQRGKWIFRPAASLTFAAAVIFVLNMYAGGILPSDVFNMVKKGDGNLPNDSKSTGLDLRESQNGFAKEVLKGDTLLFPAGSKYHLIYNGHEYELELPDAVIPDQTYVSEEAKIIYYNMLTDNSERRLMGYDIKEKRSFDLLNELRIRLDGQIIFFSYKDDRVVAAISPSRENTGQGKEVKLQALRLLEIDLKEKSHKLMDLSSIDWRALSQGGLDFFGDGYLVCYYNGSIDTQSQRLAIIDRNGRIVREIPFFEPAGAVNIKVSPDSRGLLYQVGRTPVDLYLYDIDKGSKMTVFDSNEQYELYGTYTYCFYSSWSKSDDNFYCVLTTHKEGNAQSESRVVRHNVSEKDFERAPYEDLVRKIRRADRIELVSIKGKSEGFIEGEKIKVFADLIANASYDSSSKTDISVKGLGLIRVYSQGEIIELSISEEAGVFELPMVRQYPSEGRPLVFIYNVPASELLSLFNKGKNTDNKTPKDSKLEK
ncbi:MAG: anti-sigma factor family protein [Bacillota bacterium]